MVYIFSPVSTGISYVGLNGVLSGVPACRQFVTFKHQQLSYSKEKTLLKAWIHRHIVLISAVIWDDNNCCRYKMHLFAFICFHILPIIFNMEKHFLEKHVRLFMNQLTTSHKRGGNKWSNSFKAWNQRWCFHRIPSNPAGISGTSSRPPAGSCSTSLGSVRRDLNSPTGKVTAGHLPEFLIMLKKAAEFSSYIISSSNVGSRYSPKLWYA